MALLHENIRFLRKQKRYTQQQLADTLKIKRSALGAYEEGRAKPNIELQKVMADMFGITLDQLLTTNLANYLSEEMPGKVRSNTEKDIKGKGLRVLAVSVGKDKKENIELVSQKAAAGYLNGYADPEYIGELPKFRLPFLAEGTYRAFEISGDSMLPLQPKSIVIGEYVADWMEVKDSFTYVVVSKQEGVVYKRLFSKIGDSHKLVLHSDNPSYPPFEIDVDDVLEIWKVKLFLSHAIPESNVSMEKMMGILMDLQQEVIKLKGAKP